MMPTSTGIISNPHSEKLDKPKSLSMLHRIILYCKARSQAASIKRGLLEAKAIQTGKAKAKSFEQAISEL